MDIAEKIAQFLSDFASIITENSLQIAHQWYHSVTSPIVDDTLGISLGFKKGLDIHMAIYYNIKQEIGVFLFVKNLFCQCFTHYLKIPTVKAAGIFVNENG